MQSKSACGADWKLELGISKLLKKEMIHMPTASMRVQNLKSGGHTYDPQAMVELQRSFL